MRLPLRSNLFSVVLSTCLLVGALTGTSVEARSADTDTGAESETVRLPAADGATLYMTLRGSDVASPILLWLHGGPGGAERPLFRYFNSELEEQFLVVYWDQRGAGLSFDSAADPKKLTIRQHIEDLDGVIDFLLERFGQRVVILLGHSWGSALGLLYAQEHPAKVGAFISTGQLVSVMEGDQAALRFVEEEARRRGGSAEVGSLSQRLGAPPFEWKDQLELQGWVDKYGGVFHSPPNRWGTVFGGMLRGYITPWQIVRIIRGNEASLAAMNEELGTLDLRQAVPAVEVPVSFLMGRFDRVTDPEFASNYLAALVAPRKCFAWFEESAHNAPFEEPDRFNAMVVAQVAAMRNSAACP